MHIHPACVGLQSDGRTPFRQYTYRPTCNNTNHRMWDYHRPGEVGKGFSVSMRWTAGYGGTTEPLLVGTTDSSIATLRLKHKLCWVGPSVWKQCANVFRMSSTNSSITAKPCACVSIAFLGTGLLLVCGQYTVHLLVMLCLIMERRLC
jgi:hypothetical protein